MMLLLPQNSAILFVWQRNLRAGYYAPFPSDHNVLAVAGCLFLIEWLQSGRILQNARNRYANA